MKLEPQTKKYIWGAYAMFVAGTAAWMYCGRPMPEFVTKRLPDCVASQFNVDYSNNKKQVSDAYKR